MTYKKRLLLLLLMMLTTAFFGEVKINPFGEQFRFSLGSACYFFGLIWFRSLRPLETGIAVGTFLLIFRSTLDTIQYGGPFIEYIPTHLPATVFYLVFASMLTLTGLRKRLDKPILVGLIGAFGDMSGNVGELVTRNLLGAHYHVNLSLVFTLLLLGGLRSYFVVGVYNMLMIHQVRLLGIQQRKEIERLLLINSSLFEEGFYVQKSMRNIEEITRHSYALYKQLKLTEREAAATSDLSRQALRIAEEVHELKKDSQRILAGLDKLIQQDGLQDRMPVRELGQLVINANEKYAAMLGKEITFCLHADLNLSTNRVYALISILNNLVANSVEAIQGKGHIGVEIDVRQGEIEWQVWDNGPGIGAEDTAYVFQPGYTTKYDQAGNPSTGIGLTHCLDLAVLLDGTLELISEAGRTRFVMRMPAAQLLQQEKPTRTDRLA